MGEPSYLDAPAWAPDQESKPKLAVRSDKLDVEYLPSWLCENGHGPGRVDAVLDRLDFIEGMMYPQDALKLHELAWFSAGDILEIGTYRGRSAAIMASALREAGNPARILSLDIDATSIAAARSNLARAGVSDRATLAEATASELLPRLTGFRPALVYVDGDHTFRGAGADLAAIEPIVDNGAIVVLHDYAGYEPDDPYWVRVREAAEASWLAGDCAFIGRFGLCGAFVRRTGGRGAAGELPAEPLTLLRHAPEDRLKRRLAALKAHAGASFRRRAKRLLPGPDRLGRT